MVAGNRGLTGTRPKEVGWLRGTRTGRAFDAARLRAKGQNINAGLALLGNKSLNGIFDLSMRKMGVNNLHKNYIIALRENLRSRMRLKNASPVTNDNIRNSALRAMMNYVAQRIGYKNKSNTDELYRLINAIIAKGRRMGEATTNNERKIIGQEIGVLLGSLVVKWNAIRVRDPTKKGFTPGFIKGFLTPVIGNRDAARVVYGLGLINKARQSWRGYASNARAAGGNVWAWLDPARAAKARGLST